MIEITVRDVDPAYDPGVVYVTIPESLAKNPAATKALVAAGASLVFLGEVPKIITTPRAWNQAWEVMRVLGALLWGGQEEK